MSWKKQPPEVDEQAYLARYREVMGDITAPFVPVHLAGGPCMKDAPTWHKFTDSTYEVTCEACRVAVALVAGAAELPAPEIFGVADSEIQHALAGDPDPVALAMYKSKHIKDCKTCGGTGVVDMAAQGRIVNYGHPCPDCAGV